MTISIKPVIILFAICGAAGIGSIQGANNLNGEPMGAKRLEEILSNPKAAGEKEIDYIIASPIDNRKLLFLNSVGTEKACEALLQIALAPHTQEPELAAGLYAQTIKDKSQARRLLKSKAPKVCYAALLGMANRSSRQHIDQELFDDLKRMLAMESLDVREAAARIIQLDVSGLFGPEKVQILLQSMEGIESFPEAKKQHVTDFLGARMSITAGEFAYDTFLDALIQGKGMDLVDLQKATPANSGMIRDCFIIARAYRKDASISNELYRIVRTCPSVFIRAKTLGSLKDGNPADKKLLKEVAMTDAYKRGPTLDELERAEQHRLAKPDTIYPLRERAKALMSETPSLPK